MTHLISVLLVIAATAHAQQLLNRYCAGCHNEKVVSGGLSFSRLDVGRVTRDPAAWEKVVLKLRTGMMPPSGAPRPSEDALSDFPPNLETQLDPTAALHPNPARPA